MSEEKLTAYHEAGHVVVAWVLGLEMEGASVETQGDSAGRITLAETENIELYDELLRRRLVTSYAGVNAVKM
jgi:ATP-dependent Zn protease